MTAFYVQNDAIDPFKPAGQPVLMDLRATGWIRTGILAVLLVAVGLGQQWTRLHSGHLPSGEELETLSAARSYLTGHQHLGTLALISVSTPDRSKTIDQKADL